MRVRPLLLPVLALSVASFWTVGSGDGALAPATGGLEAPEAPDRLGVAQHPDREREGNPPAEPAVQDAGETVEPLALPPADPPVAPADLSALAAILTTAEHAIRDPRRGPEDLAAAGHWQQVAYAQLASKPHWGQALAEIPGELHAAVRRNVFAGVRLLEMSTPVDPNRAARVRDLPRWRIVDPPPADELRAHYAEAEAASGVHWSYLAAINLVETRMGRIIGDSTAGAQGPMQFMPATWSEWGQGSVHDHRDAILAAGRYLRWGGMPADVNGALFRYNRDRRYVDAVRTYAEEMQADPRAFYGYYHWQVYFNTRADNVWLAPGYDALGG